MTRAESNIVLFSITLCWASSYIFIKNLPPNLSSFAYMTMTSGLAGIILVIVFFKRLRELNWKLLLRSLVMAVVICANMIFERLGIAGLAASMASFIASLTIVFVPLFMLLLKHMPTKNNVLGIVVILSGLVLTSGVYAGNALEAGAIYMVIACIFMALYIIIVDSFTKQFDPLLLGMGQMFFTTLLAFALWCLEEPRTFFALTYTREMLANIFLLAFFARAYAYIMLMYAQKYANPISVTVIASTEPVVTMALAILIPGTYGVGERFALPRLIGAGFIVAGAIIAGSDFLDRWPLLLKVKALRHVRKGAASHE